MVDEWLRVGIVHEWCRGFSSGNDGYPRYAALDGMVSIARHLAATVPVNCGVTVSSLQIGGAGLVASDDHQAWTSPTVIATPPVPQSLALCAAGGIPLPVDTAAALGLVRYVPCLALLVTLDRSGVIRSPGGVQLTAEDDPTFSFIGDNEAKGASKAPAVTFHVNDAVSLSRYDEAAEDLQTFLLTEARRFLGDAEVVACEVKKWRYARPDITHPDPCIAVHPTGATTLVFAGDAFGAAKVEGAVLSGLAAAKAIVSP